MLLRGEVVVASAAVAVAAAAAAVGEVAVAPHPGRMCAFCVRIDQAASVHEGHESLPACLPASCMHPSSPRPPLTPCCFARRSSEAPACMHMRRVVSPPQQDARGMQRRPVPGAHPPCTPPPAPRASMGAAAPAPAPRPGTLCASWLAAPARAPSAWDHVPASPMGWPARSRLQQTEMECKIDMAHGVKKTGKSPQSCGSQEEDV